MFAKILELLRSKFYLSLLILGSLVVILSSVAVKDLKSFSPQQPVLIPLAVGIFMVVAATALAIADSLSLPFFAAGVTRDKGGGYAIRIGRVRSPGYIWSS